MKKASYKIRFNEAKTVKAINAILDAIDKCDGYCPCQPGKKASTKCHCAAFRLHTDMGVPCICGIYMKQPKDAKKKAVKAVKAKKAKK
jgi:hypothetical protein